MINLSNHPYDTWSENQKAAAAVYGNVTLKKESNVWYNATIRSVDDPIVIGEGTNIQDNAIVHTDKGYVVEIGSLVTIGHGAIVHGCNIGNNVLIGMGAILLNGAVVEDNCIIGAGALVTQGKHIPEGSMVYGNPAKVVRELTDEEKHSITESAMHYVEAARLEKA